MVVSEGCGGVSGYVCASHLLLGGLLLLVHAQLSFRLSQLLWCRGGGWGVGWKGLGGERSLGQLTFAKDTTMSMSPFDLVAASAGCSSPVNDKSVASCCSQSGRPGGSWWVGVG